MARTISAKASARLYGIGYIAAFLIGGAEGKELAVSYLQPPFLGAKLISLAIPLVCIVWIWKERRFHEAIAGLLAVGASVALNLYAADMVRHARDLPPPVQANVTYEQMNADFVHRDNENKREELAANKFDAAVTMLLKPQIERERQYLFSAETASYPPVRTKRVIDLYYYFDRHPDTPLDPFEVSKHLDSYEREAAEAATDAKLQKTLAMVIAILSIPAAALICWKGCKYFQWLVSSRFMYRLPDSRLSRKAFSLLAKKETRAFLVCSVAWVGSILIINAIHSLNHYLYDDDSMPILLFAPPLFILAMRKMWRWSQRGASGQG